MTRSAVSSAYLKKEIKDQLLTEETITKSVYIQLLKEYKKETRLKDLSYNNQPILHPSFRELVNQNPNHRKGFNVNWQLYVHQEEAIRNAFTGKNIIVASGTGSGKTESFLIPVINRLLREPRPNGCMGVRCIILYPMNALVNDQIKRIRDWLGISTKREPEITFAYYTSKTRNEPFNEDPKKDYANELEYRTEIRQTPPDILVTNYSMLSYILMRPSDSKLFDGALSMVVLDEAHIYSGALATEIRLLIHHLTLRSKLKTKDIQFFLTSATLTSDSDSEEIQKNALREFAAKLTNTNNDSWAAILSKVIKRKVPVLKENEDVTKLVECGELIQEIFGKHSEDEFEFGLIENSLQMLESILSLDLDFNEIEDILEYGGWDNIKKFIDILAEGFGQTLESSKILNQLIELLNNEILSISELHDKFPHLSENDLIYLITLFNFATIDGRSLLPYRGHLFFRSPIGLFACSNPDCKPENVVDEKLGRWKRIFLERYDYCPYCKSKVVELATCNECGLEYVIGKTANNHSSGKLLHLRPKDWLKDNTEVQHYIFDIPESQEWAADLEDEELEEAETDSESFTKSKSWNPYLFCYRCGMVSSTKDGFICDCKNSYSLKVYKYIPNKEHRDKDHSISSCPRCKKKKTAGSPVQRFGGRETVEVTVLLSELHQLLPPEKQSEEAIASGRKLLAFSDTRSRAAKLAVNMNINERDILFRSLLLKSLNRLSEEQKAKPVSFSDLLDEMEFELRKLPIEKVFAREKINWEKVVEAILLARVSIDSWTRSLEGLGLLNVRISHEGFNVSEITSLSWDENKIRNLIEYSLWTMRVAHSLYFRDMLSRTPNEIYKTILEDKELVGFELKDAKIKNRRIQNFISPNNRRSKYLKKQNFQNHEIDEILSNIWKFLKKNKLINLEDGHFSRQQYFIHSNDLIFSKPNSLLICNRCSRIYPSPHFILNDQVCFTAHCSGKLQQISFEFLRKKFMQDNHYFYMYNSNRLPLICREHTAQVGNDIQTNYEREFQAGKVNLLSCSTTMELGIDIGGISTVVGSNVPPRISNYVQRVGRAGRAGAGIAAAITFSRGQSYEQYAFLYPTYYIKGQVRPPIVEPSLPPVIQRHINLFLLASFFHKSGFAPDFSHNGLRLKDIFELNNNGKSMIDGFCDWLRYGKEEASEENINSFYPNDDLNSSRKPTSEIKTELIQNLKILQEKYLSTIRLQQYYINQEPDKTTRKHLYSEKERIENEMVIRHFCYNQIFPQFSFPVDVVSLINVSDINVRSAIDDGEVRLQRDVKLALREYSPGNMVVADGKLFVSHATRWGEFGTISTQFSKANLVYFRKCPNGHVQVSQVSTETFAPNCPTCGFAIPSIRKSEKYLKPTAFSTSYEDEPKVITSVTPFEMGSTLCEPILFDNVSIENRNYILTKGLDYLESYFAPSGKGEILFYTESNFRVCKACGYSVRVDKVKEDKWQTHFVPYRNAKCDCSEHEELHFGTSKKTDILYARINPTKVKGTQNLRNRNFWYTLLQLILESIPNVLNIERNDIDGLIWTNENLQYEMILFDDVPNGAGHMKIVQQNLKSVFDEAKQRIFQDCCDRACPKCLLTFYNQHFDDQLDKKLVTEFFETN